MEAHEWNQRGAVLRRKTVRCSEKYAVKAESEVAGAHHDGGRSLVQPVAVCAERDGQPAVCDGAFCPTMVPLRR